MPKSGLAIFIFHIWYPVPVLFVRPRPLPRLFKALKITFNNGVELSPVPSAQCLVSRSIRNVDGFHQRSPPSAGGDGTDR